MFLFISAVNRVQYRWTVDNFPYFVRISLLMTYTATVTSKRQITLPIKLFADFGIEPGDKLTISKQGDGLLVQRQVDLVNKLYGSVRLPKKYKGLTADEFIQKAKESYWDKKAKKEFK